MTPETYEVAFKCLKDAGFDVYPPQTKRGKCLKPYIVLKDSGAQQFSTFSSAVELLDVMIYVPLESYSKLFDVKRDVMAALRELSPMLQSTFYESTSFYDDSVSAHMLSIEYQIHTYRGVK